MAKEPNGNGAPVRGRTVARGLVIALATLGWVYTLVGAEGIGRQKQRLERRAALRVQLAAELEENSRLRHDVELLRADDLAIEQAIRAELDYQRPGEQVMIVADDDPLGTTPRPRVNNVIAPPIPKTMLTPKPATAPASVTPGPAASSAKSAPTVASAGSTESTKKPQSAPASSATPASKKPARGPAKPTPAPAATTSSSAKPAPKPQAKPAR